MKRTVFFIVILFCCSLAMAQQKAPKNNNVPNNNKRVLFGASAGPTVDWFAPTSDGLNRVKSKAGFMTGINVDANITKGNFLYFSTGVLFKYLQGDLTFNYRYVFNLASSEWTFPTVTVPTVRNYEAMYLTIPTGVTFRISVTPACIIIGKIGLYHNFKVGGDRSDNFSLSGDNSIYGEDPYYFITTTKVKNDHAALFTESAYAGLGFEYMFKNNLRVFTTLDYSCQFNYFNSSAISNVNDARFKTMIHSFNIVFGFMF